MKIAHIDGYVKNETHSQNEALVKGRLYLKSRATGDRPHKIRHLHCDTIRACSELFKGIDAISQHIDSYETDKMEMQRGDDTALPLGLEINRLTIPVFSWNKGMQKNVDLDALRPMSCRTKH